MPGAKFKRQAIGWAKTTQDFYKKPYAFVKHEMVRHDTKHEAVSNDTFHQIRLLEKPCPLLRRRS